MLSLKTLVAALAALDLASGAPAPAALEPRLPGRVVNTDEPVVIDPNGEYIRVSFMNDGSLIGGYMAKEGSRSILRVVHSTDGAASVSGSSPIWKCHCFLFPPPPIISIQEAYSFKESH